MTLTFNNEIIITARDWGKTYIMTSQELTKMIANNDYPDTVNSFYRDWIGKLYADGRTQQAVRMLQSLIDNPQKPVRTLL